jgi:hypothetical protein
MVARFGAEGFATAFLPDFFAAFPIFVLPYAKYSVDSSYTKTLEVDDVS